MRSLFAKIMLAQVVAVVLALLIVLIITRQSLDRGFTSFLERQESGILGHLAPVLSQVYQARGDWEFLHADPDNWERILQRNTRLSKPPGRRGPASRLAARGEGEPERDLRWLRTMDRLSLRDRLFLLDENRRLVAGPHVHGHDSITLDFEELNLEPVIASDVTVGWIGFAPLRHKRPPEVSRFLKGQIQANLLALAIALGLVSILSWVLARHLTRPVSHLDATVDGLSRGEYERRAEVESRDEIGRLAGNVNHLAATLEKNRTARRRWMSDTAHELRTPVAILKGEIEALRDGLRTPDAGTLASLADEVDHLSRLVDDLQSLALADAGALNLERTDTDLGALARQTTDAFKDRLGERGVAARVETEETRLVRADKQRIQQLMRNLLENCARYTSAGGEVVVTVHPYENGALLNVSDNGPGVSDLVLDQLFERFYREESSRARVSGGSGLGLSICRSIAEAHGGRIWADSNPDGGLGIHVYLPA